MADKIYVYDERRGAGIPGLPHVVTEAEAEALGLLGVLKDAVKNGSYKVKAEPKTAKVEKE